MTEDPRGRYPVLKKPGTRAMQGARGVWFAVLVEHRKRLIHVQQVRRGLRSLARSRR